MRRNLFLYLTLACFFGIVLIFIVDGYMGVYDTIYVTSGERPEKIEADFWLHQGRAVPAGMGNVYSLPANQDDRVTFVYEVDNRRFASYAADVEVSVWHSQEKVRDLVAQSISIPAFDKRQAEWAIDNAELLPGDIPPEQSYQYTVIIRRGEIERRIIMDINRSAYPPGYPVKPLPAPPR